jgi:hypothetical protein
MADGRLDLTALRRVAVAANRDSKRWFWKPSEKDGAAGYPQIVLREGDVGLICETYDSPDRPAITPEFIATFDPPTVMALLDLARRAPLAALGDQQEPA